MADPIGGAVIQLDQEGVEAAVALVVATKMLIVLIGQLGTDKKFDADEMEKLKTFSAGFTLALSALDGVIPVRLGGEYRPEKELDPAPQMADEERVH